MKKSNDYNIAPKPKDKLRSQKMREIIIDVLNQKLKNQTFQDFQLTTREIADSVKLRLKELALPRYKYVVKVFVGQLKGQGIKIGGKCFWDNDTDVMVSEQFMNDHIFCLVNAYGVYYY